MRANRIVTLLVVIIMFSAAVLSGCSSKTTVPKGDTASATTQAPSETIIQSDTASETTAQIAEEHLYECTKQGFSFLYDGAYTVEWDDLIGVTVYIQNPGEIPYVQIYRGIGEQENFDVNTYFPAVINQLTEQYGDRVISTTKYEYYHLADKKFDGGASVKYRADLGIVDMLILTEVTKDSVIQYICRCYEGQGEESLRALEKAVMSYRQNDNHTGKLGGNGQTEDNGQGEGQGDGYYGEMQNGLPQQNISLVPFDGGFFSVMLPQGWQIYPMGLYSSFGFRAWDPLNPDYEIFYYGTLTPLNKNYESKNFWQKYINNMGYPFASKYADAPVIDLSSASSIFYAFNTLQASSDKQGFGLSYPALENFTPLQYIPLQTIFAQISTNEEMVFASLIGSNGGDCRGKFSASIGTLGPLYIEGIDMGAASALNVTGVIAPRETFLNVEAALTQAVSSLRFTEQYINDGVEYSRAVGEAAMANNEALWSVFDEYTRKWTEYFRGDNG